MRLRTPYSTPVIGWNEEHGFVMAGKAINIDPEVVWDMAAQGWAELNKTAMEALKLEVEK